MDSWSWRRRAFLLPQLDGHNYDDIALVLGVSLITVKHDMKQAFLHCLLALDDTAAGAA